MPALISLRFAAAAAALFLAQPALANHEGGPKTGPAKPGQAGPSVAAVAARPALASPVSVAAPSAPQTVTLTGVVLHPDGTPCAGAAVFVVGFPRQLVVTDAKGAFALPVPVGAALNLQADLFGEGSSRLAVPVPSGKPLRLVLGQ